MTGYVIKAFVLPPGVNLFGVLIGTLFMQHSNRLRRVVVWGSIATLWIWSVPFAAAWLAQSLERYDPLDPASIGDAQAIVVLAAGTYKDAREYGGVDTVAHDTLERLRYGVKLARDLKLPLAVTGGTVFANEGEPVAVLMARVLAEEFHIPARWIEDKSRNTAETYGDRLSERALNIPRIQGQTQAGRQFPQGIFRGPIAGHEVYFPLRIELLCSQGP